MNCKLKQPRGLLSRYIIPLTLCALLSCSYQDVQVGKAESVGLRKLSPGSVGVDLYLPIENPNPVDFRVTRIMLEVEMNGQYLGTISNEGSVTIRARSRETYKFGVDLEFDSLVRSTIMLVRLAASGKSDVSIRGYIVVKASLLKKKITINQNEVIRVKN